jgi:tetratricopeptide (TPR) repeat protein
VLFAKKDYDLAIADYDQATKLNPAYPTALINRGNAWRAKGMSDRAAADYGEAVRVDPNNALAFMNRAIVEEATKQRDGAIADYGEVIRLTPTNAPAWSGRCWSRAVIGELGPALVDCNEALRLENSVGTLERRALVYLKSGQLDKAIADYGAALKTNPRLAGALYGRGLARLRNGDTAAGNADIAAAKEVNPRIVDVFAGYNVPAQRAEAPAVEAPPTSRAGSEVVVPGESATPGAPAPAIDITTSVGRPPPSEVAPQP